VFVRIGSDVELAKRLYALARHNGLEDVQYRPFFIGVRSTDPWVDLLPATVESMRGPLIKFGLLSEAEIPVLLAACRAHLGKPDTVFTLYTVAQVWGRKPG
jgi:hypothetical protein